MAEAESINLHVPLEKPPQALTMNVRKILGKVVLGEIRVPAFQRPLRWQSTDVVKLFDSILRGYPIGSLLFWKRAVPADLQLRIGNARISAPASAEGWYIVDGQQRITALAAALLDLDHDGDKRWTARFDPVSHRFLSGPAAPAEQGLHVPLSALGDLRRLSRWLRDCALDDDLQSYVEVVQQRLLDYEIPAYLMDTEDPEALKGVFARLNSTGVRMRPDEVFQALLGTGTRGRGPLDLSSLQQACDLDGFGQPPRQEILKAVLAMSGHDPSKRLEDLDEGVIDKLASATDATEALQRTVAFLQSPPEAADPGAGIPAYAFLPYPVVFVILARWFHLFPDPDATTRRDLAHWLWRGVVTGVHQRAAVSKMRLQVRNITPDDMEQSLRDLRLSVPEPARIDWTLAPFNTNHSASRVELLTLLSLTPRDREAPVSWRALVSDGGRVASEIFRGPICKDLGADAQRLLRTAANRALLDTDYTGLRAQLKRWSLRDDRAALESHLIDEAAHRALLSEDVTSFVQHRGARLRIEVSKFLTRRAGLGAPRLRPVDSYFDDEPVAGSADPREAAPS